MHSKLPNTEDLIEAFRSGTQRWLISVDMISEGADLPCIRVIVNLSRAGTELYFRHLAGRAIRAIGEDDCSRAYMIMPDAEPWVTHAARYEEEQGRVPPRKGEWICAACRAPNQGGMVCAVCGEPRRQRRRPAPWLCGECGALNGLRLCRCLTCDAVWPPAIRPPPPPPPVFEYTLRDTAGRRDGVISRGAAITEPDVVLGEALVDLVCQVDRVRPGFAGKLFQIVRPEELAFLREAADAINAAAHAAGQSPSAQ